MILWLLLLVSSQLWWVVTCPPSHIHEHDCDLAGKDSLNHQFKELLMNNKRRQLKMEATTKIEKPVLKMDENKVNLKTNLTAGRDEAVDILRHRTKYPIQGDPTEFFWNRTSERCDFEQIRCMRAYATGAVCARTMYYQYYAFPNYCAMEFHNCVGRYGFWQVAYMGICSEVDIAPLLYVHITYDTMANYTFLKQMYTWDSGEPLTA